jgi:hypothetical protein
MLDNMYGHGLEYIKKINVVREVQQWQMMPKNRSMTISSSV